MPSFKTTEFFIEKSIEKHGNKYDYSDSMYVCATCPIEINCKIHGTFHQTAGVHYKHGCKKCGILETSEKKSRENVQFFKYKAKEIHPDLCFKDSVYTDRGTKVKYVCAIHGIKEALPYNILSGHGCDECGRFHIQKGLMEERILECENIHNNEYNYSKIVIDSKQEDLQLIGCEKHGDFKQSMSNHRKGHGCPKCGMEKTILAHKENPTGWTKTNWQNAAEKSKNFDSFKVYIIKCWNDEEEFYKIGRTFLTIKKRFQSISAMPYNWEIRKTFIFEKSEEAYDLEVKLKNFYKNDKYLPMKQFCGRYECFKNAAKNILKEGISGTKMPEVPVEESNSSCPNEAGNNRKTPKGIKQL